MCGVYGIVRFGSDYLPSDSFYDFTRMVVATQDRGVDGTGFVGVQAWLDNPVAVEFRSPNKASEATMTKEWDLCKSDFLESPIIIGVNRAAPLPEGDSSKVKNQPPFVIEDVVLTHNGTFSNDRELFAANPDWKRQTEVDTEVVAHLWRKHADCRNLRTRIQEVCREIVGGFTAPIVDLDSPNKVIILHNFKPLAVVFNPDEGLLIYNSELKNIVEGWGSEILEPTSPWKVIEVGAFESLIIDRENMSIEKVETPHTTWSSLPPVDNSKAVVICSGGLDSVTASVIADKVHHKKVTLLHANYGQVAKDREWEAVQRIAKEMNYECKQIDVSYIGDWCKTPLTSKDIELPLGMTSIESTKVWVPARNQLFLTLAAAYCEATGTNAIYSGFNLEESGCLTNEDCNSVRMADGKTKKLPADIKVGDELYAWDEENRKLSTTTVTKVHTPYHDSYLKICFTGRKWKSRPNPEKREIHITGEHPVYVKDKGWIRADEMNVGDVVFRVMEGRKTEQFAGENNPFYGSSRVGELNPMYGTTRTHTEETKAQISETLTQVYSGEGGQELKQRISDSLNALHSSPLGEEVRKKISDALLNGGCTKRKQTWLEKYGVEHYNQLPEARAANSERTKQLIADGVLNPATNLPKPTSLERNFMQFLNEHLPFTFRYVGDGQIWLTSRGKHMNPDFVNLDNKWIIETIGPFWHTEEEMAERVDALEDIGWNALVVDHKELEEPEVLVSKITEHFDFQVVHNGLEVSSIEVVKDPQITYDFTCEPHHNFFIGKSGILVHNCYPDNTMSFFNAMNKAFDFGTLSRVKINLVLERLMKTEIIKLSTTLSNMLAYSWSCDTDGFWHEEDDGGKGRWRACGRCGCCVTRRHAFIKARIEDPQLYHYPLEEKFVWLQEGKWTDNSASIDELLERVKLK